MWDVSYEKTPATLFEGGRAHLKFGLNGYPITRAAGYSLILTELKGGRLF
jgi:hypothetical protein